MEIVEGEIEHCSYKNESNSIVERAFNDEHLREHDCHELVVEETLGDRQVLS